MFVLLANKLLMHAEDYARDNNNLPEILEGAKRARDKQERDTMTR